MEREEHVLLTRHCSCGQGETRVFYLGGVCSRGRRLLLTLNNAESNTGILVNERAGRSLRTCYYDIVGDEESMKRTNFTYTRMMLVPSAKEKANKPSCVIGTFWLALLLQQLTGKTAVSLGRLADETNIHIGVGKASEREITCLCCVSLSWC